MHIYDSDLMSSPESYRKWVTALRQEHSRRLKWEQATSAGDSSSWPTTTTEDAESSGSAGLSTDSGRHPGTTLTDVAARSWVTPKASADKMGRPRENDRDDLQAQTRAWPTPAARDVKSGDASDATMTRNARPLNEVVEHWPTPEVPNGGRRRKTGSVSRTGMTVDGKKRQVNLEDVATGRLEEDLAVTRWPTPDTMPEAPNVHANVKQWGPYKSTGKLAEAHSSGNYQRFLQGQESSTDGSTSSVTTRRLNPRFVEWLMGWPLGWTDSEPLGTEWFRWLQLWRSLLFGESFQPGPDDLWPTPYGFQAGNGPDGNEFSTMVRRWGTPSVGTAGGLGQEEPTRGSRLQDQAGRWPTPNASGSNERETPASWLARRQRELAKGRNGNGMGTPLAMAATLWSTPRTITGGGEAGKRKQELGRIESGGGDLQAQAQEWELP